MQNLYQKKDNGKFIISLDLELFWGVRDVRTIQEYGNNIQGVHTVIPRLLEIFEKYKIRATFSIVGLLFFENKKELIKNLPSKFPTYIDENLSPYVGYINTIGEDHTTDLYHYAPQLIKLIKEYPTQEIGTHTFSHYYCLERGQNVDDFVEDIIAAKRVADNYGIQLQSLIFPRNQFNEEYLKACIDLGIICIRGNEQSWIYQARGREKESQFRRAVRLVDSYINISGHNCYTDEYLKSSMPTNIPSSRFLRPFSKKIAFLDSFRLNRIKNGMTYAAKNNMTYHLWWHPHNFGINQNENFIFLEKILVHYQQLNQKYNFESYTMSELSKLLNS
jgi:peptidoglycan/xylan/chitin deacetylase (PgdA/CDA1 family)